MSQDPETVDLDSPDLAAEKLAAFEGLFPGVVMDGVLDAARLGELLDTEVTAPADGRERFGLMWAGKQDAVRSLLAPSRGTLIPEDDDQDSAGHVFIEGDNLEALKLLQKAYNDQVKLIYIDPPYNTGSNDFIYPDDFTDTLRAYLEFSGQVDAAGNRTSAGADVLGRRHSRWLSMMYPRLVLARNLLKQDGVIFVSIDDNEVANLRELMDEIFGPENFIAQVVWEKVYAPMNNRMQFAVMHDYVLVYARNAAEWVPNLLPRSAEQDAAYKNPDNDPRGPWKADNFTAPAGHATPSQHYELVTPAGNHFTPPVGRAWVYTAERYKELLADNRVWFGKSGQNRPAYKRFLSEVRQGRVPETLWPYSEVGHNQDAKKELLTRVTFDSSASVFNTPKPTQLIRRMLTIGTATDESDIVLDFFAGSGSTADAVLQQNAEDGGNRRFIVVQLPEPTGFDDFPVVSDITRARISAAVEAVSDQLASVAQVRSYRLGPSNFVAASTADSDNQIELHASTLAETTPSFDHIAAEVFLKEGVPLDAPWQRLDAGDASIVSAEGVSVVLSLDLSDEVVNEALALATRVAVLLEDGFRGADSVKANAVTNAKQLGITLKTV